MEKPRIFISYRRKNTTPYALWICDRLAREFGREHVFFDLHSIPPGEDFVEVLTEKVESCDVLLAVIGHSWLTIADDAGQPRIQNSKDFVVIEIGTALRRKVPVIPILVGGASMPGQSDLPEELVPLARKQKHELPDKGFIPALESLFPLLQKSRSTEAGAGLETSTSSALPQVLQARPQKTTPFESSVDDQSAQICGELREVYVVTQAQFAATLMIYAPIVNNSADVSPTIKRFVCRFHMGDLGDLTGEASDPGPLSGVVCVSQNQTAFDRGPFKNLCAGNCLPLTKHNHREGWLKFSINGFDDSFGSALSVIAVDGADYEHLIGECSMPWPQRDDVYFVEP